MRQEELDAVSVALQGVDAADASVAAAATKAHEAVQALQCCTDPDVKALLRQAAKLAAARPRCALLLSRGVLWGLCA